MSDTRNSLVRLCRAVQAFCAPPDSEYVNPADAPTPTQGRELWAALQEAMEVLSHCQPPEMTEVQAEFEAIGRQRGLEEAAQIVESDHRWTWAYHEPLGKTQVHFSETKKRIAIAIRAEAGWLAREHRERAAAAPRPADGGQG